MTAVLTTPEDFVNNALAQLGRSERVGSMFEGSVQSKIALDIYGQTRDDLLREGQWDWARRDVALSVTKTAPPAGYGATAWSSTYPPLPWKYQFSYPADCLKIRSLRRTPVFMPVFDPQPVLFSEVNDNSVTPTVKAIVSNIGPVVIATYTGQVINPANWEANFGQLLIDALALKMAPKFNEKLIQVAGAEEAAGDLVASTTQG